MKKEKKLMIVFHDMKLGGIQRKTIDIINFIQKNQPDVKITLCLRNKAGIFLKQLPPNIVVIGPIFHTAKLDMIWFIFWMSVQLIKYNPTHILSFMDLGSIPTLIALKIIFWKKPQVTIGEDILTSKYIYIETFPKIRLWLIKTLYPNAHRVLVQTQIQKNDLDNILNTSSSSLVQVSPNWLPLDYQPLPSIPKKDIDILFVGRFDPQKNLFLFLDIISDLQKIIPGLQVTMVGGGPDTFNLKSHARKNYLHVQFVSQTLDVKNYYLRSKIFLLTSDYEGFPLTVLEAAACFCLPVLRDLPEILTFLGPKSPLIFHTQKQAVTILKQRLTTTDSNLTLIKPIQNTIFTVQNQYLANYVSPILAPSR
jgi:glycosyltransferase involved in cell wall biosynthesis